LSLDEREAKAAILALNSVSGRVKELEEAWVVLECSPKSDPCVMRV
jgi:hypothetical protein